MSSPVQPTKRNIEIKARIHDEESFEKRISIAKNLTKIDGVILNQHDVFFNVSSGRLKLRMQVKTIVKSSFFYVIDFYNSFFIG